MVSLDRTKPEFAMGHIVATPGALSAIEASSQTPVEFLHRHVTGDWGNVSDEDAQANEDSLARGARLLSSYRTTNGTTIWIITEADRSATTLLVPEEY